jgi:hypothetical protein
MSDTKIQRWKPSSGDINKIKMEVSPVGNYIKYSDFLDSSKQTEAKEARIAALEQILQDPENQHSQYGTVPLSMYEAMAVKYSDAVDKAIEYEAEITRLRLLYNP